ncbi:MAG TPA: hypothetical protein ENH02_02615 [Bacteroidetes bacterium]|nr:hypothetical protein [Bacteroidota bacterium]
MINFRHRVVAEDAVAVIKQYVNIGDWCIKIPDCNNIVISVAIKVGAGGFLSYNNNIVPTVVVQIGTGNIVYVSIIILPY